MMGDHTQKTKIAPKNADTTVYAGAQEEKARGKGWKEKALADAEKHVALDWDVGDVILDLYEVLPVDSNGNAFHAGGFGKVYKVRHKAWNTELAVKSPHAHAFATFKQKQNFISESPGVDRIGDAPEYCGMLLRAGAWRRSAHIC